MASYKLSTIAAIYALQQAIVADKAPCTLTQHYFAKQVVQIAEQVDNEFIIDTPLEEVKASVQCAYDFAKVVADSGGLVYTQASV